MNDWYIDRSKNFVNPSVKPVLSYLDSFDKKIESNDLISSLISKDIFSEAEGNPNAALTRFRDHGLIDNDNRIGDSAHDYINNFINIDEMIIDLFLKRPCLKKNSSNLKPFVCLCRVFDYMFDLTASIDDVYLSCEECYKYLYKCNDIEDVTIELVDEIMNSRDDIYVFVGKKNGLMKQNDVTNLSIWFNALKNTPLFIGNDYEKTLLRPNYFNKDFFSFISINANKFKETPTNSNSSLYKYYCDRNTGIYEIVPYVFKENIVLRDERETEIIINYLFGIKKEMEFDFSYYFESNCFGVYHPFISIPRLIIRYIYEKNKKLGKQLYCFYNIEC